MRAQSLLPSVKRPLGEHDQSLRREIFVRQQRRSVIGFTEVITARRVWEDFRQD